MANIAADTKIQKLLALAEHNTNGPEVQAALLKVQTRFLTLCPRLNTNEPMESLVVAQDISMWFQRLVQVIATNFRVRAYANYERGQVTLSGRAEDVTIAGQVLLVAKTAAQRLAGVWWADHADQTIHGLEDYLHGFGAGLAQRFNAQVETMGYQEALQKDAATEESPDAVEPVLASEAAFLQGMWLRED